MVAAMQLFQQLFRAFKAEEQAARISSGVIAPAARPKAAAPAAAGSPAC
jgi:hypothetical protein